MILTILFNSRPKKEHTTINHYAEIEHTRRQARQPEPIHHHKLHPSQKHVLLGQRCLPLNSHGLMLGAESTFHQPARTDLDLSVCVDPHKTHPLKSDWSTLNIEESSTIYTLQQSLNNVLSAKIKKRKKKTLHLSLSHNNKT